MGMKIPADLRMIECTGDCMFDRSILTGEVSFASFIAFGSPSSKFSVISEE